MSGGPRELGQLGTHFWYPKFQAEFAAWTLREGIGIPYVQEMIRKNRLLPGPGDLDLKAILKSVPVVSVPGQR